MATIRPTIVGTPTTGQQTVTTAKNVVIAKPSGVADGDWLIAGLRAQDASATGDFTLTGWTRIGPAFVASSASGRLIGFFAKYIPTASAETATSYTFAWTGSGGRAVGVIVRVQGADPTTLVDASSPYLSPGITNGTRMAAFTVPDANGLQLTIAANEQTSPNASETVSHTAGYSLVQAVASSTGTSASRTTIELYQNNQDAGSTTQFDVTWAVTASPNAQSVVLRGATVSSNAAPTASFTTSLSGFTLSVVSTATDSDGTIASTDYDWGDSTTHATMTSASHTYAAAGTYTVTQTVTDNSGATATATYSLTVQGATATFIPHFGTGDSTSATSTAAASLAVNKPANVVNGDLLVANVYNQLANSTVAAAPAGWTLAGPYTTRGGGIYTKPIPTASAETATTYTWSFSGTGRLIINIFRVTGADLTHPLDVSGTQAADAGGVTTVADASITTNYANSLLLGFNFWNNSSTAVSTITPPSGMTAGDQITTPTTANTSGMLVAYQTLTTAGATGTRTFTYSPAPVNATGMLVALKKATSNPAAAFTYTANGETLSVDGTSSSGTNGATIASYDWDWGDSTSHGTASVTTHTYASSGTYSVTLTVTDSNGLTGATSQSIVLSDAGYPGVFRDANGTNHPGVMYYWDGTAKRPLGTSLTNKFQPVTVSQFLAHQPWFAAHRGFSYSYPEETLYSYRGATDWKIKAIEVSVQKSADGTFWCFHDATTDRTTGVSGTIASMTDAQLSVLSNLGSTAAANASQPARPIAKLVDVLNLYASTHVIFIEDKTYANTTAMLNLMDSYGTSGRPATEIFIWKVDSGSNKASYYDTAAARGYHRWAYIFDSSMAGSFNALVVSGKADMIGMDYNSSDSVLSAAIAACITNGVMPTGHIVNSVVQRDRLLGLGMKGVMISNKDVVPPWYNV